MIYASLGLDPEIDQSAAYVESWSKALKDDKRLIFTAGGAAQAACNLILEGADATQKTGRTPPPPERPTPPEGWGFSGPGVLGSSNRVAASLANIAETTYWKKLDKNGRFCPARPALPQIKGLDWTKAHDKTFAVLGGFWHRAA